MKKYCTVKRQFRCMSKKNVCVTLIKNEVCTIVAQQGITIEIRPYCSKQTFIVPIEWVHILPHDIKFYTNFGCRFTMKEGK